MSLKYLNFKVLYRGQLILHLLIMLAYLAWRLSQGRTLIHLLSLISIAVTLLGLFQTFRQLEGRAGKVICWLQLLALPQIIRAISAIALAVFPTLKTLIIPLALIYFALALLPAVYELVLPVLKKPAGKIILAILWGYSYMGITSDLAAGLPEKGFLHAFLTSGIYGSLVLLCLFALLMRSWSLPLPDWKPKGKPQLTVLLVMAAFCLYLLFLNNFQTEGSWLEVLLPFNVQPFSLTWEYVLTALRAGILEESMVRYVILLLLLTSFSASRSLRQRTVAAICLSSALFGLLHLSNILTGQDIPNTLVQVLAATAIGLLFAPIYLYTGKLSLAIAYHSVWDIITFSLNSSTQMSGPVDANQLISDAYYYLIIAAFSLYMLTGKRRAVIESNVAGILEQQALSSSSQAEALEAI